MHIVCVSRLIHTRYVDALSVPLSVALSHCLRMCDSPVCHGQVELTQSRFTTRSRGMEMNAGDRCANRDWLREKERTE